MKDLERASSDRRQCGKEEHGMNLRLCASVSIFVGLFEYISSDILWVLTMNG